MNALVKLPTNEKLPSLCLALNFCAPVEAITFHHLLGEASRRDIQFGDNGNAVIRSHSD